MIPIPDRQVYIFIASFIGKNTGIGGHYRSALTLMRLVRNFAEASVVSFGDLPPAVYEGLPNVHHVHCTKESSYNSLLNFLEIRKGSKPETEDIELTFIVIMGGIRTLNTFEQLSRKTSASLILCRPGGPPYRWRRIYAGYPAIVFSGRDLEDFKKVDEIRPLYLFSSRTYPPDYDPELIERFNFAAGWSPGGDARQIRCLIVCRILRDKDSFISPTLDLLTSHIDEQISIVFVGIAQDPEYFNELANRYNKVRFITSSDFTLYASKLIYASDVMMAIGRTAQESLAAGIPTFIPIKPNDETFLCEVNRENLNTFLFHNCTERASTAIPYREDWDFVKLAADYKAIEVRKRLARSLYISSLNPDNQCEALQDFVTTSNLFYRARGKTIRRLFLAILAKLIAIRDSVMTQ